MPTHQRKQHIKHFVKTREIKSGKKLTKEKTEYIEVKQFLQPKATNKIAKFIIFLLINLLILIIRGCIANAHTV